MTSTVEEILIEQINAAGKLEGTERIAIEINAPKWWVLKIAQRLAAKGRIHIVATNGGRGHKTVYKRNRNSPGAPRRP